ncbi:hypothetical protein Tco_0640082 [Tanacetum coccineum]
MVETGRLLQCSTFVFSIFTSSVLLRYPHSLRMVMFSVKTSPHGNAFWGSVLFFLNENFGSGSSSDSDPSRLILENTLGVGSRLLDMLCERLDFSLLLRSPLTSGVLDSECCDTSWIFDYDRQLLVVIPVTVLEDSDMDISTDDDKRDDDDATITTSSMEDFSNLLYDPPVHELTDILSKLVYTDAHTTSAVANLEGNHEVLSYLSSAPEVPFGTNIDVQATDFDLQEMFLDDADHPISSSPTTITYDLEVEQKFKEYDQKLEALTSINVPKAIEEAVQAKVLTEMKKQLPTYVPISIANLFTPSSPTTTDDLSEMELKLKMLNRMYQNKSNETYDTNQKLYNTLYESITLDQEALDAQDTEPSFYKRSHDDPDPPNDREGETRKKRRKDAGKPSRSSKKDKDPVVPVQEDTLADQPQDQEEYYIKKHHILGPSTVAMAKKLKALIKKDELTIEDLEGGFVQGLDSFEKHISKSTKPHNCFDNNDFYYLVNLSTGEKYATSLTKHFATRYHIQGIEDMILDRWGKKIHRYQIEALNGIHHWEDARKDFFKAELGNMSLDKVYSDKRIRCSCCCEEEVGKPAQVFQGCERDPNTPTRYLYNKDLFFFKNINTEARKYVISLPKIHATSFPEDDLEEVLKIWVGTRVVANDWYEVAEMAANDWYEVVGGRSAGQWECATCTL